MSSQPQEAAERVITYTIGGFAMLAPNIKEWLDIGTSLFTFLTAVGGFVLVCWRLHYDWKKGNAR
jgi:hypothetical protein